MASSNNTVGRGSATYMKKQGTLAISIDQKSVTWTPKETEPGWEIEVRNIEKLQQTPATSARVILKFLEKVPVGNPPVAHAFTFDSPSNPRGEADAIKDALNPLILALKTNGPNVPQTNGTVTSGANASSKANGNATAKLTAAASKPATGADRWFDDSQLLSDIELQTSLMKTDPALKRTLMESRLTKPAGLSESQFNSQFWSTRISRLRAHAVESNQKRGEYNVLAVVKPLQVDGEYKLNMSLEQQNLIFNQYPVVKRAYSELVPKKLEKEKFWSSFFVSALHKTLKGESYNVDKYPVDPFLDKYIQRSSDSGPSKKLLSTRMPHLIDLEGNEDNQGGSKSSSGNQPDITMRTEILSNAPIIQIINSLSEKIMAHVAPSDVNPADPIGMSEATFKELALRDLQGDAEENRIMLNIREQSRFFSNEKSEISAEAALYAKQKPHVVIAGLRKDVDPVTMASDARGQFDLKSAIGVLDDSDSEDEEEKVVHVGSKASLGDAQRQILETVKARRIDLDGSESTLSGLSQRLFDRLTLINTTTTEFLHHFWVLFLSGNPDKADELKKLFETLDKAIDRIDAIGKDADKEREETISTQREMIRKYFEETRRKRKFDPNDIGGGKKVVREMMAPTIKTLRKATNEYTKALKASIAEGADVS